MKAEHRKELETNALANRMGQALGRVRQRPERRTYVYLALLGIALLAVFVTWRYRRNETEEASARWVFLEDGARRYIASAEGNGRYSNTSLSQMAPETTAGKAARLQDAWLRMWEDGLKEVGKNTRGALARLDDLARRYRALLEDCAGDPVFEPEAKYMLAVIEETHALQNRARLDSALKLYQEVATSHKDSARGKAAADRVAALEDSQQRAEIAQVYQQLQTFLGVPEQFEQRGKGFPDLPGGLPGLPPPPPPAPK